MTALSLEQQSRLMLRVAPRTKISYLGRGKAKAVWMELVARPTAASATYSILVTYTLGDAPLVWVTEPALVRKAHGRLTPHLYSNGSLCLFDPAKAEWTEASAIAYTILPWALRWLFHYEHWLVFGDWRGDPVVSDLPAPDAQITIDATAEPLGQLFGRGQPRLVRLPRAQRDLLVVALADRGEHAQPRVEVLLGGGHPP